MNDKIKELAVQAGYTPLPGFDFANSLHEVFMQKFAELIVQECASIAYVNSRGHEHHDMGTVFYYNADVGDKIKHHFGVEN